VWGKSVAKKGTRHNGEVSQNWDPETEKTTKQSNRGLRVGKVVYGKNLRVVGEFKKQIPGKKGKVPKTRTGTKPQSLKKGGEKETQRWGKTRGNHPQRSYGPKEDRTYRGREEQRGKKGGKGNPSLKA